MLATLILLGGLQIKVLLSEEFKVNEPLFLAITTCTIIYVICYLKYQVAPYLISMIEKRS